MASKVVNQLKDGNLSDHVLENIIGRLKTTKNYYEPEEDRKLYDGEHKILKRDPKKVKKKDENGTVREVLIHLNKIVFHLHHKIVETAIAFLFGEGASIEIEGEQDDDLYSKFEKVWKETKMNYTIEEAVRHCMIETKSAILFYMTSGDEESRLREFSSKTKLNLRMRVLSYENGDEFYPHWDNDGKMDAFVRIYKIPDYDREDYTQIEPKTVQKIEIYTKDRIYHLLKRSTGIERKTYENSLGKIPVVYFDKKYPEWHGVNSMIERIEDLISKQGDTNDYFAFPALVVKGEVHNLPDKGEVGKLFEVEGVQKDDGSMEYPGGVDTLTWDQSPQSVKDEYERLMNEIYSMTHTPDISLENLKGTTNISGIALKLMFLDAYVKARNNEKLYGDKVERVINIVKDYVGLIATPSEGKRLKEMDVRYKFKSILPDSVTDLIDNLTTSVGSKPIMSQKTAVEKHPYIEDPKQEEERLSEENQGQSMSELLGASFNP